MKIYLASPMFAENEKQHISSTANLLRSFGYDVYVPMEHKIENAWDLPNHEWAQKVFQEDIKQIQECDQVVALYYGLYSDSGTAWEIGYAYGINKPVQVLNFSENDVSLMVVQSCINTNEYKNINQK